MSRRLAISDIHGCPKTFEALLDKVRYSPNKDRLFLLGDYVNKGPDSKRVLEIIYDLKKRFPDNVTALLGNHDQQALSFFEHGNPAKTLVNGRSFGEIFPDLKKKERIRFRDFFRQCPLYAELPDFLLVHAGFDFTAKNIFKNEDAMTVIREFVVDPKKTGNRPVVHGHVPTRLSTIKQHIADKDWNMPLDNGCVYADTQEGMGQLICLDLDTLTLTEQANIDLT
ncbi:serine/threonine protein phosphatase [Fulvitalea axinellae]|uniref:Serine/threonine protein phosphatase n=1 Tax=Fulvitalea axinellae TaxID=1182444 RepID=A0AAU9CRR2_9BACT|nr:serine/threonine protein phosphatase [Fulvitalea axinellae]